MVTTAFLHWGIRLLCSNTGQLLTRRMFPLSNPPLSFPSRSGSEWSHLQPPSYGSFLLPVNAGRKGMTQESSLHVILKRFLLIATIPACTEWQDSKNSREGGQDKPAGWNVILQSTGMVDSRSRGLELSSKFCSGKEMFPAVALT